MHDAADVTSLMKTLADPTRRAMFERIFHGGEMTVGALVREGSISQPAVSQHLRALREAGLVNEEKRGRQVFYRTRPEGLGPLAGWLGFYGRFWTEHLGAMEKLLDSMDE